MRHAIVVGVGPGIGLATAQRFGREGFTLSVLSRNPQPHADALSSEGYEAHAYPADAGDPTSLKAALESALEQSGPAEVLLYNAARLQPGGNLALEPQELMAAFAVNVGGALLSAQTVLPGMLASHSSGTEQGHGTVLFTGGGLALNPNARYGVLALGKAALRSLALTLAQELEPQGVHVATVTVAAWVQPGSETAHKIAQHFWELHGQARADWQSEIIFSG